LLYVAIILRCCVGDQYDNVLLELFKILELNISGTHVTECFHFIVMFKMDYLRGMSSDRVSVNLVFKLTFCQPCIITRPSSFEYDDCSQCGLFRQKFQTI